MSMQSKSEQSMRLHALGVAIVTIAMLGVAFFLKPSPAGVGTHRQLGLPTCGWILAADTPCPTCGMTTAWSHTVRGEFLSAFVAQPVGMLLALLAGVVAVCSLFTVVTGYSFHFVLYLFSPSKVFLSIAALMLVAWGFKILIHRGVL